MMISKCGLNWILGLIAVLGMSACTSFPITSIYKLRNFDPMTTDIRLFRIAVRVPDEFVIPAEGIALKLSTRHEDRETIEEVFYLESINDRTSLDKLERVGTEVSAYGIAPDDTTRFTHLQEKFRIEKTHGAKGSLEVRADVCRTTPVLPSIIPLSTFVKASETKRYVPLMVDVDILGEVERNEAFKAVPECSNT